ncbi:MAG TPA: RNA methyltransferase [candidate division Zixibacteria bacterium]|nr:RNA methyltransferase [candidate division Zixibacteria bacterium]HEQ99270.1 RNA methyltransferase [candidate division Zixibacteria bacterium]
MDLTQRELSALRKLNSRKGRKESGRFLVEGVRCVKELVSSDYECEKIIVCRNLLTETGRNFLDSLKGFQVYELTTRKFNQITDEKTSQGIIAVARAADSGQPEFEPDGLVLVIQKMSDPSNLGSIIRSAVAFGAKLIIGPQSVELYSPRVISASSGYLFKAHVKTVRDILLEISTLHENSFVVWGADKNGQEIGMIEDMPARIALVIGHEAFGLADDITNELDKLVGIPISSRVDSLSAPIAASILMQRISERMGITK